MNKKAIVIIMSAVVLSASLYGCEPLGSVEVSPDVKDYSSPAAHQLPQSEQQIQYTVAEETSRPYADTETSAVSVSAVSTPENSLQPQPDVTVINITENHAESQIYDEPHHEESQRSEVTQHVEESRHSEETVISSETSETRKSEVSEKAPVSSAEIRTEPPVTEKNEEQNIKNEVSLKYVDGVLIVNKSYPVPEGYKPDNLVYVPGSRDEYLLPDTLSAFQEMCSDAWQNGLTLWVQSGFRSYELQTRLYNDYVASRGKTAADTFSARPGYSEHHTGLALDLNTINDSFANTAEGRWVAENCWKYGFIIRYPKDKENITGYKYEPWHLRYLGRDLAKSVYESGLCLEEYFGLTSSYNN